MKRKAKRPKKNKIENKIYNFNKNNLNNIESDSVYN